MSVGGTAGMADPCLPRAAPALDFGDGPADFEYGARVLALGDFPPLFLYVVGVTLGLLFGSFLNVVVYRLPREENLAFPGSRCPGCGKPIRAWNNVPVLSYLVLRGKAACCGTPISPRYPLIEAMAGLFAYAVLEILILDLPGDTPAWHAGLLFLAYLVLGLGLIAVAFIDLEWLWVPDSITYGGTLLAFASLPLREELTFTQALFGAAFGFLLVWLPFDVLYRWIRGRTGMALGDAKLVMLAGAWSGWPGVLFVFFAGSMQGTIVTLSTMLARGKAEESEAVKRERLALKEELERAEGEEREKLEQELKDDPLAEDLGDGFGTIRIPLGPFLVLAFLEYLLFAPFIRELLFGELL
jgi:leader peptidase (prepilin peptidase)/N-methyltransferase